MRKVDILIGFKKDHDFASPKYSIHKHRLVFILVSSFRLQISPLETSVRFLLKVSYQMQGERFDK